VGLSTCGGTSGSCPATARVSLAVLLFGIRGVPLRRSHFASGPSENGPTIDIVIDIPAFQHPGTVDNVFVWFVGARSRRPRESQPTALESVVARIDVFRSAILASSPHQPAWRAPRRSRQIVPSIEAFRKSGQAQSRWPSSGSPFTTILLKQPGNLPARDRPSR